MGGVIAENEYVVTLCRTNFYAFKLMNIPKFFVNVAIFMVAGNAAAKSFYEECNLLCNFNDGSSVVLKLPSRDIFTNTSPLSLISFNATSVTVCADRSNPTETYEYTFEQLDRNNPFSLVDPSFTSVETLGADNSLVIINPKDNGVIEVSGTAIGKESISVYDITGHSISVGIDENNGFFQISLNGYPTGVYIIKVSGVSVKVIKK